MFHPTYTKRQYNVRFVISLIHMYIRAVAKTVFLAQINAENSPNPKQYIDCLKLYD